MSKSDDYEVGYGRAPIERRFTIGKSGNPKGRPTKRKEATSTQSKSFSKALLREIRKKISIQEGGKNLTISKQRALAKIIVNSGLKGTLKDAILLAEVIKAAELDEQEGNSDNVLHITVTGGLPYPVSDRV